MNFYEQIVYLNEKGLRKKIKRKIDKLERKTRKNNPDYNVLGYHVPANKERYDTYEGEEGTNFDLEMRCFYNGYICKNSKVVYGLVYDLNGNAGNYGSYYYVDDDEYIYDFCKYIQEKEIEDIFELLEYMLDFLKDYFGRIKLIDRNDMFQLLYKNEDELYDPIQEHSITHFKNKGNAMCTEYSVMAQNLMRVFDIESYLMIGTERIGNTTPESHAYNLVNLRHEGEELHTLIDFTNYVNVYDIDFKKVGESPFIGYLDKLDDEIVESLVLGEKHLTFDDYAYYIVGNTLVKLAYERERDYYVDTYLRPDKQISFKKTK